MTRMISYKRLLSMALAFCLVLSMLPPITIPVFSETSTPKPFVPVDGKYDDLIGYSAALNFEDWIYLVISDDPTIDVLYGQELVATDLMNPVVLVIADCYWDAETCALWLKVKAADGYELPEKLQTYPWVFQNYTDVYEEEGWEAYSSDSLLLSAPAYKEPTSIVADGGVTVHTDGDLLTDLIVTDTAAPSVYYFHQAVAYRMTPKTNDGKYTGQADVTLPIPEGWDRDKLFGFVVEPDGSITNIPGTVTEFGSFHFTVPHFSVIGIAEVTAVSDLETINIYFGKISQEYTIALDGNLEADNRYTSEDGAVEYAIYRKVVEDKLTTYVTFKGIDVTENTEIILGNTAFLITVQQADITVEKLLAGSSHTLQLLPFYDLGISGDYTYTFEIASDTDNLITLNDNGVVDTKSDVSGFAQVVATITNEDSKNTVATVTYRITVTDVEVNAVENVYVPNGCTLKIYLDGQLKQEFDQENVVKVSEGSDVNGSYIIIEALEEFGHAELIVGTTLFHVYTEQKNTERQASVKVYISIIPDENLDYYYSINGGVLHKADRNGLLVGLDDVSESEDGSGDTQLFPNGFSIFIFSAAKKGYATSGISGDQVNYYFCLSNGTRYDGSDSDAWPFVDPDEDALPMNGNNVDTNSAAWKAGHGFKWGLAEGNLTIAQMRDMFTAALAVGCDTAITYTKNSGNSFLTSVKYAAEKLPEFRKTISHYKRANPKDGESADWIEYSPDVILEIGDQVRYKFEMIIWSTSIDYSVEVIDTKINGDISGIKVGDSIVQIDGTSIQSNSDAYIYLSFKDISSSVEFSVDYTVGESNGLVDEEKIKQYPNGKFTNQATLQYSYKSPVASGATKTASTAVVTCRINSIVTWVDNLGSIWHVKTLKQGTVLPSVSDPFKDGYRFDGWNYDIEGLRPDNGNYIIEYGGQSSLTIIGDLIPENYELKYEVGLNASLPEGAANPLGYTILDHIQLVLPTKEGHTFVGWIVTHAEGNWVADLTYASDTTLLRKWGNVTLTAQWVTNQYTITFDSNGGTPVESITQDYGTAVTAPTAPTKEGFTFAGWEPALPETMPAQDMTLKAVWTTSLAIEVAGWQSTDANQAFLFRIEGEGLDLYVAVYGNESVVIEGLIDGGSYTVTEVSDWSWRYGNIRWDYDKDALDPTASEVARIQINGTGKITFTNSRTNTKWLDGNNWLKRNIYRN